MSLTIKAYLKSNDETEIRRFSVDEGVTTSYEYLSKKLVQVFPKLEHADNIRASYKDSEGDLVTFSSDEELIEGLGQLQEEIFRVYIQESKRGSDRSCGPCGGEEEPAHHLGVVCDGCEGQVRGPRFKCKTCPDYDLCRKCKKSGVHAEHEFKKIPRPVGRSPFFGPGQWNPGMGRFPPFAGPFGCHPGMRRFHRHQQRQQQQQEEGGEAKPNENTEEMSQEAKQATEFLQKMGESVAQMLDPFGIDVDIDVEHGGVRFPGQGRQCGQGGNGKKGKGNGKHGGKGKKANKSEETPDASAGQEKPMEADTEEKSGADNKQAPEGMETDSGKPHGSDNEWTMVQDDAPGTGDPRQAQALAQMKAMGFDDEAGWLSQLLKAKGYDIGRVLDAIKMGQPRVGGGNY